MRCVWKYTLDDIKTTLQMPWGAEVLCVDNQRSEICLWALVDPDRQMVSRAFQIVGTGHREVPTAVKYIGTIQRAGGDLILHVFEVPA